MISNATFNFTSRYNEDQKRYYADCVTIEGLMGIGSTASESIEDLMDSIRLYFGTDIVYPVTLAEIITKRWV